MNNQKCTVNRCAYSSVKNFILSNAWVYNTVINYTYFQGTYLIVEEQ